MKRDDIWNDDSEGRGGENGRRNDIENTRKLQRIARREKELAR